MVVVEVLLLLVVELVAAALATAVDREKWAAEMRRRDRVSPKTTRMEVRFIFLQYDEKR